MSRGIFYQLYIKPETIGIYIRTKIEEAHKSDTKKTCELHNWKP